MSYSNKFVLTVIALTICLSGVMVNAQSQSIDFSERVGRFPSKDEESTCEVYLNDKTGDIVFSLTNRHYQRIPIDLVQYCSTKLYNEVGGNFKGVFFASTYIPSDGDWPSFLMIGCRGRGDIMFSSAPLIKTPNRKIVFYQGESFSKSEKFWQLTVWRKYRLVERMQDDPKSVYDIVMSLVLTCDSQKYIFWPKFPFDQILLRKMLTLEKKYQQDQEKADDRKKEVVPYVFQLRFDAKMGDVKASIATSPNEEIIVTVDLNTVFGSDPDPAYFTQRFYLTPDEEPMPPSEPSESRVLNLEQNETVAKTCKIWELAIWSQVVEHLKSRRNERVDMYFPFEAEVVHYASDTFRRHEKELKRETISSSEQIQIDYRTMIQMEKLREASQ